MPINSRNKGAAFEREVCTIIGQELGCKVKRNLDQYQEKNNFDISGLPGWAIECKRYNTITEAFKRNFWEQAVSQVKEGFQPVVIYKADRQPIRCLIHANDSLFDLADYDGVLDVSLHYFLALCREMMN